MTAETELVTIDFTHVPLPRGPWTRGSADVVVEEREGPSGAFALYMLPGGQALCVMPAVASLPDAAAALAILWRAVANLSRVCPVCSARASLDGSGAVPSMTMEHERICPLSDAAMADAMAGGGLPLPDRLPACPRAWVVRPPRLAIRRSKRRRR